MVAVFVSFQLGSGFDESKMREIAEQAQGRFVGMPHLRYKVFTACAETGEATNLYVWEREDAARAFYTAEFIARVTRFHGVPPIIRYATIPALVENAPA